MLLDEVSRFQSRCKHAEFYTAAIVAFNVHADQAI